MVKIIVLSDTHKSVELCAQSLAAEKPADLLINLGDYVEDGLELSERMGMELVAVRGDNDFTAGENERELEIPGLKIFLAHGHSYNIDDGLDEIYDESVRRGARLVLFGHSHRPVIHERDGVLLLNPGSLYLAEKEQSFGVIRLEHSRLFLGIYNLNRKGYMDVREISLGV
jgi:uncharacterized protein